MVINGTSNILIPNHQIDKWDWTLAIYKALNNWKTFEFDPKIKDIIANQHKFLIKKFENQILKEDKKDTMSKIN